MQELKVGDVVALKANIYSSSKSNPDVGSVYYCNGRVRKVPLGEETIEVAWYNGTYNYYHTDDLISLLKIEPKWRM